MQITFVADRAWPAVGGAEMLARHVARALGEHHDVTVLAIRTDDGSESRLSNGLGMPPPFEPFTDGAVRYEPLRLSSVRRVGLLPTALQVTPGLRRYAFGKPRRALASAYASVVGPAIARAQKGRVDVVHTWSADLVGAAGVRAARALGAVSVITPFLHVGQWGSDPASVAAYRAADRTLALLDTERKSLIDLGVPNSQVGVCGACTPAIEPGDGPRLRAMHGIDGPLIAFLGVRRPYKGYDRLLEAAPGVADRHPDATFVFIGPGEPVVAPAGVRVVDVGKAKRSELGAWLDAADLLCLPSDHEIFPTSMLEAWSVGTPSLVSDIPTLSELIQISGGGRTAPRNPKALAAAINQLLASPEELRALGRRGQKFWRDGYTPEAIADRHVSHYQELLSQRTGGTRR